MRATAERPSAMGPVVIRQLGGAIARVPATATAFGDRSAPFNVSVDAIWEDPADDQVNLEWTRDLWRELHDFSTGQAYLNFPGQLDNQIVEVYNEAIGDETRVSHGTIERWADLQAKIKSTFARYDEVMKREVDAFNALVKSKNVDAIVLKAGA